jgi:hypothetical protein
MRIVSEIVLRQKRTPPDLSIAKAQAALITCLRG